MWRRTTESAQIAGGEVISIVCIIQKVRDPGRAPGLEAAVAGAVGDAGSAVTSSLRPLGRRARAVLQLVCDALGEEF